MDHDDDFGDSHASEATDNSNPRLVFVQSQSLPVAQVHSVPFNVTRDVRGTKLDAYFHPREEGGGLVAQFRGREMLGRAVPLPAGATGIVFRAHANTGSVHAEATFNQVTVWHRDPAEREVHPSSIY
jgi:hypothetical protein